MIGMSAPSFLLGAAHSKLKVNPLSFGIKTVPSK